MKGKSKKREINKNGNDEIKERTCLTIGNERQDEMDRNNLRSNGAPSTNKVKGVQ